MGLLGDFNLHDGRWRGTRVVESLSGRARYVHTAICQSIYHLWDYYCYFFLVFRSFGRKLWPSESNVDGGITLYYWHDRICWFGNGQSGFYDHDDILCDKRVWISFVCLFIHGMDYL